MWPENGDAPAFPFVRSILQVEEVDSTSDLAKRLIAEGGLECGDGIRHFRKVGLALPGTGSRQGKPDPMEMPVGEPGGLELPAMIWADRQTRGRGQRSNVWWSDSGSLTVTLVLDPASLGLNPEQEPSVAMTAAVAVIEAIVSLYPGCRPGIRWPNDIEVEGRKLGGILPERVESPSGPRLLIGIGLNVRTRLDHAPLEVRRMAASLGEWASKTPPDEPKDELLRAVLDRLGGHLRALIEARPDLFERWNRLDTLAGSRVRIEIGAGKIEAIATGIDESGGLRIFQNGQTRVIHAGRVLRD